MATNYFLNQYFTTTLNVGGGIDASQTTGIIVQAVSGLDITKPGVACITYADPINTSTAEWVTYTSIDGSNELQGVTRGAEGFGAKTHSNGAVIAFPLSESHINTLATALSIGGVATNGVTTTLDEDTLVSDSATALATQQSIKAYVDSGTVTMTNKTLTSPVIGAITNTDHITITPGTSKLVKTAVLEQATGGTNTYRNNMIMLTGFKSDVVASGTDNKTGTVTFGVTFSTAPVVVVQDITVGSTFASENENTHARVNDTPAVGSFAYKFTTKSGNVAGNRTVTLNWIAIGTLS